jgi:LPXTG-motif cell wall-anchored protein
VGSDKGTVNGQVKNNSGAQLPSTGGIGTTIFYILGAILIIGAGIALIARRRTRMDS